MALDSLAFAPALATHEAMAPSSAPRPEVLAHLGHDGNPDDVRAAAQLLESHFLTMLLQEMRGPVFSDENEEALFAPSRAERTFTQQLDQALGDALSQHRPLGLADMIVRQLAPDAADQDFGDSADT